MGVLYLYFVCLGGPRYHSGSGAVLQIGRSQLVSLEFFNDIFFRSHYGPGVDSDSNRNEYQERIVGVKVAGA